MTLYNPKWPLKPLKELCEIIIGRTPSRSKPEYWGEGYKWLSISDLKENKYVSITKETITDKGASLCKDKLLSDGTVVFSFKLSIGKVSILSVPMYTNEAIVGLQIKNASILYTDYLYYVLKTLDVSKKTDRAVMGATLNKRKLEQIQIPLPPLEEQKRIARILDKADEIRRKRKQAIALTDELLRSTFLEMFGDPVINPKGWEVVPFKQIFKNIRYGTSTPPIFEAQGIPFIRATNIKNGTISENDLKYISLDEAKKIKKCRLKEGDIIIVRSGVNSGDSAVINNKYKNAYAGYDLIIDIDPFLSVFYNYLINTSSGKFMIKPLTRRAGQPHLNAEQIKNLMFIFPPESYIKKFNIVFEKYQNIRNKNLQYLQQSENLFNSLLQRAFKGEL